MSSMPTGIFHEQEKNSDWRCSFGPTTFVRGIHGRLKKWQEALGYVDLATARAHDTAVRGPLYRYRARYHSELNDNDAAIADLDKEIALESEAGAVSAKALILRGKLLQKNHRSAE